MSDPILPITPIASGANNASTTAITLRIPKLNMQLVILILLAVVTLFQTIQLWSLKGKTAQISIKGGASSGSSAPAAAPDNGLQGMVGGC